MSYEIDHTLREIEILIARKNVAEQGLLFKDEYVDLLVQIKAKYEALASLYMGEDEDLLAYQVLLRGADILFEICELVPDKIGKRELYDLCDRFIQLSKDCYDVDISRSFFVAIARLNYYLNEYIVAEEYVQKAFDDYDYSVSTFQLYMNILDKQHKYKEMLTLMKNYLKMGAGLHEKCSVETFLVPNILHSPYASAYKGLFN